MHLREDIVAARELFHDSLNFHSRGRRQVVLCSPFTLRLARFSNRSLRNSVPHFSVKPRQQLFLGHVWHNKQT